MTMMDILLIKGENIMGLTYSPVSVAQIYRCESFLCGGFIYKKKVSDKQKRRIIEEYGLSYSDKSGSYTTNDINSLFECFKKKFSKSIERLNITDYMQLVHITNANLVII